MVASKTEPSVFSQLGTYTVVGAEAGSGVPKLRWSEPCWPDKAGAGPKFETILFSATSKMNCPSFSLPAGPPEEGGTCVAARRPKGGGAGLREEGRIYTCDQCYAFGANYAYSEVAFSQAVRAYWVEDLLRRDPTGQAFADAMVGAISEFARRSSFGPAGLVRLRSEIGVWRGGRIHVPVDEEPGRARTRMSLQPSFPTLLPPETGVTDSQAWIAEHLRPTDGQVAGFFRLHDSGDFNVGSSPTVWLSYIAGWGRVARALPGVVFWAPTRTWVLPPLRKALVEVARVTPNFVVRPSGLHVGDAAPAIEGLSAGSTVAQSPKKDASSRSATTFAPAGSVPCPVYLPHWDPEAIPAQKARLLRGERGDWVEVGSCQAAGCRRCWIDTPHAIAYGLH
jgi:hypothetical protein